MKETRLNGEIMTLAVEEKTVRLTLLVAQYNNNKHLKDH